MKVTIHGKEFEVAPQPADYWGWVAEGRYDHEWRVYDEFVKPEHTFVDLGAWVGSHTLYASRIARMVIAAEPDPVAHEILLANVGKLKNVYTWRGAVGETGTVQLGSGLLGASTTRKNPQAGGGIGAWELGQTFEVQSESLEQIVSTAPGPLFIKLDIEGSEEIVLKDLGFFSLNAPTLLIELHPWWWVNRDETRKNFDRLTGLYRYRRHVDGQTWLLWN